MPFPPDLPAEPCTDHLDGRTAGIGRAGRLRSAGRQQSNAKCTLCRHLDSAGDREDQGRGAGKACSRRYRQGNPSKPLLAVATTFLATSEVIRKAAGFGANLVITHEPIFYNHRDQTQWLVRDAVLEHERQLIDRHDVVVLTTSGTRRIPIP